MSAGLLPKNARNRWCMVPVEDVCVYDRQRAVEQSHVDKVAESFAELGGQMLLQPIVVSERDGKVILIDGAHRLAAAKQEGWTHIAAIVWTGLDAASEALLENQTNLLRKQLSPVDLEKAWTEVLAPAFREQARANQADAGALNLPGRTPALVTVNDGNWGNRPRVSLSVRAKEATGLSLQTLKKVTEIRRIAESEDVIGELSDTARDGLARIHAGTASVNAVHRELRALSEVCEKTEAEREDLRVEDTLDSLVNEITMLPERLRGSLGADVRKALTVHEYAPKQVSGIRIALTHALGELTRIECEQARDRRGALREVAGSTMKTLNEITTKGLKL